MVNTNSQKTIPEIETSKMITQKRAKSDLSLTNVMVNNMDPTLSKNDAPKMRAYFSQFGAIVTATVHVTDSNFYGPKTVFIEFQNEEDANNCVTFYKKNKVIHHLGGLPIAAKFSFRHSDPKNKKPKNPGSNDGNNNKSKSNMNLSPNLLSMNQHHQQQLAAMQLQNMYLMPQIYQQAYNPYISSGAYSMANLGVGNSMLPNIYSLDESQYGMDPTMLATYSNLMTNNILSQMMLNNSPGMIPINSIPVTNNLIQPQQISLTTQMNDHSNEKFLNETQ